MYKDANPVPTVIGPNVGTCAPGACTIDNMLSLFLIEAIFKIRRLEVRPPVTRRVLRLRVEVAERKRERKRLVRGRRRDWNLRRRDMRGIAKQWRWMLGKRVIHCVM